MRIKRNIFFLTIMLSFLVNLSYSQCALVTGISSSGTNHNSTTINFTTPNANFYYVIVYYKVITSKQRQNLNDPGSPYPHAVVGPLTSLTPSSTYSYYIVAKCLNGDSTISEVNSFTTSAAPCNAVSAPTATGITQSMATISATAYTYATSYTLKYVDGGTTDTVTVGPSVTPTWQLNNLVANTQYYYRIISTCPVGTNSTSILNFTTGVRPVTYTPMINAGYDYKRTAADSTLSYPTGCGAPSLNGGKDDQSAIYFDSCNHLFYFFDPKYGLWDTLSSSIGGAGGDCSRIIELSSADFDDETICTADTLHGIIYGLYWDDVPAYIYAGIDYNLIVGGFQMLTTNFDATANDYTFHAYLLDTTGFCSSTVLSIVGEGTELVFVTPLAEASNIVTLNTVPIAKGGTNSIAALNNNRILRSSAGAIVEAAAITANRLLISDANGIPTYSTVTNTEAGYLSGVTSAIQTQINNKQTIISKSFQTLTDGGTVTWTYTSGYNASLTIAGNRTLAVTGDADGDYGTLIITQDASGNRNITVPAGDKLLDGTGTGTTIDLTDTGAAIDIISYVKRGSVRYWTKGYYH